MSIRAIDMAVLYTKTAEVDKMQQVEQQQGKVAQQDISAHEIKRKDVENTQVQHSPKGPDGGKIEEQQERKNRNKKAKQELADENEKQQSETPQPTTKGRIITSAIDITV